ncbi:hypothetical protein KS4_31920 [Poriferisphaera corsica]|uniref:Uncharacterized protein n=1 Tax=Poriferisphaera corsica TaxID=2528020 RepID=A0A517YY03_9BACT|nr:hypothetical protein KS4_31920 [Poriferisphaera corsica]
MSCLALINKAIIAANKGLGVEKCQALLLFDKSKSVRLSGSNSLTLAYNEA